MANNIVAVSQWVTATTIDGVEPPTEANWLAILQTHADRQQFLYEKHRLNALRLTALNPGVTQLGACAFEAAGVYIAVESGGGYAAIPLCLPGDNTAFASGTLTGSPTFTGDVPSAVSDTEAVFVYGAYAYRFVSALTFTRYAFASLTTTLGVLYSPYSGKFFAIGTDGSNGIVEWSTNGVTWAVSSGATSTNNGYSMIASDATGQYILVAPNIGDDWAYSDDGGATWTVYTVAVDSDTSFTPTDLCYDDANSQWLMTLDSASFSGDATRIWKTSDPTTTSWTSTAALPNRGLKAESVTAACGVIAIGEYWLAGVGSSSYFNILQSSDQGVTWERAWGNPDNTYHETSAPLQFHRSGKYVFFTDEGVPGYITDAL